VAKILTEVMSAASEGGGGKGVKRSAEEEGQGGGGGGGAGGAKRAREEDELGTPGGLQTGSVGVPSLAHKDVVNLVAAEAPVTVAAMSAEVVDIVEGGIKDKEAAEEEEEEEEEEGRGGLKK
jgi:hypothetical protein